MFKEGKIFDINRRSLLDNDRSRFPPILDVSGSRWLSSWAWFGAHSEGGRRGVVDKGVKNYKRVKKRYKRRKKYGTAKQWIQYLAYVAVSFVASCIALQRIRLHVSVFASISLKIFHPLSVFLLISPSFLFLNNLFLISLSYFHSALS